MTKPKTWAESLAAIDETFRKWGKMQPEISNILQPRQRSKRYHTLEECEVQLRFSDFIKGQRTEIKLTVRREDTAPENLHLIAVALEMVRLAEVRGVSDLIVQLYRQMHPQPQQPTYTYTSGSTRAAPPHQVPAHYALLYLDPSAPLDVCEAVYRRLATRAHPDAGGSPDTMVRLNAAIELIRKEKQSV